MDPTWQPSLSPSLSIAGPITADTFSALVPRTSAANLQHRSIQQTMDYKNGVGVVAPRPICQGVHAGGPACASGVDRQLMRVDDCAVQPPPYLLPLSRNTEHPLDRPGHFIHMFFCFTEVNPALLMGCEFVPSCFDLSNTSVQPSTLGIRSCFATLVTMYTLT